MTKTQINFDLVENSINTLYVRIENIGNIFDTIDKSMMEFKEKNSWKGTSADSVFEKYEELQKSYEPIKQSLNSLNKFVETAKNSYSDVEVNSDKDVEEEDLNMG